MSQESPDHDDAGTLTKYRREVLAGLGSLTGGAALGLGAQSDDPDSVMSMGAPSQLQSGVPIRNFLVGPAADLPADADGNNGDYYIASDSGAQWHHDGSTWNKQDVEAPNASVGSLDAEEASINDFKNRLSVSISPHQFATVRAASSRSDEYINMQGNVSSVYTNLGGDRRDQYGSIYVDDSKIWHHDPTTGQMVEINDNQPDEKNFFAASRDKRGEFLVIVEDGTDADGNVIYEAQFYLDPANIGDSANAHRTATGFGRPRQYGIEQLIDNSGFIFAEYSGTSTSRVIRYDRSVGSFETALDVGSTGIHLHRISINPDNKNMYVVNAHGTTELYESTDDGATWSKLVSDDKRQVEIGRAWPEDGYAYWGADTLWDEGDTEQSRVYRAPVGDQSSPELLGKVPDAGIMIYGNSVSFDPYGILMSGSQDAGRKGADGEHAPLYFWSLEIQEEIGVSNITTENPEPLIKLTEKTLSEGGNSGSFGFRDLPPYMNSEVGGWVVPTASLQKIGPRTEKQVIVTLDKLQSALP